MTPKETVLASVTHAMKEIEPVVEVGEEELFLDEDGEVSKKHDFLPPEARYEADK